MLKYLKRFFTSWVADDPKPSYSKMDLRDPQIVLMRAALQYLDDVQSGLTEERNMLGVECPECGAGRHQGCKSPMWPQGFVHPARRDFAFDVHECYAEMIGRDSA